jgi:hypothetical protein
MAILGVDDFKARLKGGGARANLFKVTLNFPAAAGAGSDITEKASFLCKTAQLPQSSVGSFEVPFRGRILKLPSERTFDPWTVTILNDTDFAIRDAMERWSNSIAGHQFNTGTLDPTAYQTDLVVEQLDRDGVSGEGRVIKRVDIRGAFPATISPIELSYDTTGEIETFDVEFAYQYWESNTTS